MAKRQSNTQAKQAGSVIRDMQMKPHKAPQRRVWDILSNIAGALQILNNDGAEIINVAPYKTIEIDIQTKAKLDASSHFQALVNQGKVRVD